MKKTFIFLVVSLISLSAFSQGFKKAANSERIGKYEMGNYMLNKHKINDITTYSISLRDQKYNLDNFLRVNLGTKEEAITFFENVIATLDSMENGDSFDLELPDGNFGFYVSQMGVKKLGITVGEIEEYGLLSMPVAKSMLKDLKNQKE